MLTRRKVRIENTGKSRSCIFYIVWFGLFARRGQARAYCLLPRRRLRRAVQAGDDGRSAGAAPGVQADGALVHYSAEEVTAPNTSGQEKKRKQTNENDIRFCQKFYIYFDKRASAWLIKSNR